MSGILNAYSGGTYSGLPGAPTIGTATATGATTATVAFTAPTNTGGLSITGYQAISSPGSITATGSSSPITVTGLTALTAYTFQVRAQNAIGYGSYSGSSNSVTPVAPGQQTYAGSCIGSGTFSWTAPAGVTSVSVVALGANGYGNQSGGGGGGLAYANNVTVVPGNSYTVFIGRTSCSAGGDSYFGCSVAYATGGAYIPCRNYGGAGGYRLYGTGGGSGGNGGSTNRNNQQAAGGGGAGGYSGNGGAGGNSYCNTPSAGASGSGGGGGGGAGGLGTSYICSDRLGMGGGTGLLGQGSSGAGGSLPCCSSFGGYNGYPGSGGGSGCCRGVVVQKQGGGSGGRSSAYTTGAVRIIWPGTTRSFPSTNTGNL